MTDISVEKFTEYKLDNLCEAINIVHTDVHINCVTFAYVGDNKVFVPGGFDKLREIVGVPVVRCNGRAGKEIGFYHKGVWVYTLDMEEGNDV